MRHSSERKKLKSIREGQREAYEAVISQYYKSIYRFMAYLTDNSSLAEDLTQETFTSAWANIDNYKGRASMRTWLHKIAYHKFIDSKRRLERDATLMAKLKVEGRDVGESLNPLYRLAADEHLHLLYEAIHKLDPSEHIVIVLHYFLGFSFREMAKVLDEPVGTIKWQTNKALKRIKGFLIGRVQL